MSELGDAVWESLTSEWKTVAQIADAIPQRAKSVSTHREMVRSHLTKLRRYGMAER